MNDKLNGGVSPGALAQRHCVAGVESFIRWQLDADEHLDAAIESDESYVLPKLVKAWMLHGGRDARFAGDITNLSEAIEPLVSDSSAREGKLWASLCLGRHGLGIESATVLEEILFRSPKDLLTHQLLQEELFWMGRSTWMRDVTERAAPAWHESDNGYGAFLSMRAFANEEAGSLDDAERFGRMAVEMDSTDIWGAHAVAHVLMMKGEMSRGIEWLERLSSNWQQANQLRHHLWWHICLYLLDMGQHERVLQLLTSQVRNPDSLLVKASPAMSMDITNYSSLLMRLELFGVDVGEHWLALATICAGRINNHGNAFNNCHDMMVLAATGQLEKANQFLDSMRSTFASEKGSVALAYNATGITVCEALLAHRRRDYKTVIKKLGSVRQDLYLLGASHAQREVFYHVLVHATEQEKRFDLRSVILRDIERIGFHDVIQRAAYQDKVEL